jgi:glycosyltransferase involved in cell wall biosynthesis
VVANSQAGLEAYHQAGKRGRVVLYNGLDMNRFSSLTRNEACSRAGMKENCFNVVMIASLRKCYSKDPFTFVRVAQALRQEEDIRFYLVGDGELRQELEAYAAEHDLSNLKFLGLRNDVEVILRACDISVLTSKTEGISNAIMEAMACGIPVIATSKGGTAEIIQDGVNGYLLPFGDFQAIAQKIISLKNEPEVLKQAGTNALQTIQQKFSMQAMIQTFESIIGRE